MITQIVKVFPTLAERECSLECVSAPNYLPGNELNPLYPSINMVAVKAFSVLCP
jgi:hypothetical protein